LEGRGPKLYLVAMIDDATSQVYARFAEHDSTAENLRVLWGYLQQWGRPLEFYTDKSSLFTVNAPQSEAEDEVVKEETTQIGRALKELGIKWIAAHSPQAKGRIERFFGTAQDRLVKGLRIAKASSLEGANRYLEQEYLPSWNRTFTVVAAKPTDAHRPLSREHDLAAILSQVEARVVTPDYTIRYQGKIYQIARADIRAGLRGGQVRVERRWDGSLRVKFREHYVSVTECRPQPRKPPPPKPVVTATKASSKADRAWMKDFNLQKSPPLWAIVASERAAVQREMGSGRRLAAPLFAANSSRPTGSFR
jgi:hypothetical protein